MAKEFRLAIQTDIAKALRKALFSPASFASMQYMLCRRCEQRVSPLKQALGPGPKALIDEFLGPGAQGVSVDDAEHAPHKPR